MQCSIDRSALESRQLIKRLVAENKYTAAHSHLLELLTASPNDYMLVSQIAFVSYQLQSYDESMAYYKQCIDIIAEIGNSFINNWFSYHQYAKLLHLHLNDYQNAKTYYIKSLRLNECNFSIYFDIAQLYVDIKNYVESQTYFEQYFDLIESEEDTKRMRRVRKNIDVAHFEYAKLLFYKLDRKTNGKSHIQIAIELKPKNIDYHYAYCKMLKICQEMKKAKKHYLKCIELSNSKDDKYLYEYGIFLTDCLKDTYSGILFVKKAFDLKPKNEQYKNEYLALKNWNDYQSKAREQKAATTPKEQQRANHKYSKQQSKKWATIINTKKHNHVNTRIYYNNNTRSNNREIYNSIKRDARRIKFGDGSNGYETGQTSVDWDRICGTNNKYTSRIIEFKSKFKIACQAQAEHNYVLAKNILEDLIQIAPEDGTFVL